MSTPAKALKPKSAFILSANFLLFAFGFVFFTDIPSTDHLFTKAPTRETGMAYAGIVGPK
jgi:hypothetical protein